MKGNEGKYGAFILDFLYLNVTKELVWERLFFIKLFLLINSGGKLKLEHHCFSTPNGIIGLPRRYSGKESACQCRRCRFHPWVGETPLEKGMTTSSSILVWEIPWMEEFGELQFMGS